MQFRTPRHDADDMQSPEHSDKQTPEEMLESVYQRFRGELAAEVLSRVKKSPPAFFERLWQQPVDQVTEDSWAAATEAGRKFRRL